MKTAAHRYFSQLFETLFRCSDCNGRGKRWHAKWPLKVDISYADPTKPISGTDGCIQKEWKTCETCRGTGRH